MTVSVGAISLDDNLRLDGLHAVGGLAGSARATMGGVVIQQIPMPAGRVLALVATRDGNAVKGMFTGAQLADLAALRDAGQPVTLIHHLGTWSVWLPPDCLQVEQVFDYADPDAAAWYVGTLSMITV